MKRLLLLSLLCLPWCLSWASGTDVDVRQSNDQNLQTTGDQVIKGGDAFGAAHGLGDVDIEGCVVTKQWGSFIVSHQYYEYDVFCIAEVLDSQGKYDAAAALRCSDKDTAKLFGDSCISVWTFRPAVPPHMEATPNQGDERYLAQQEEIEFMREELAAIKDAQQSQEKQQQQVQVVQQEVVHQQQQQQQQLRYTEAQRAEVAKILGITDEDEDEEDE